MQKADLTKPTPPFEKDYLVLIGTHTSHKKITKMTRDMRGIKPLSCDKNAKKAFHNGITSNMREVVRISQKKVFESYEPPGVPSAYTG